MSDTEAVVNHPERFEIGERYRLTYDDQSVTATCIEIRDEWGDGAPNNQGQVDDFAFIPGDHPFVNPLGMFIVDQDFDKIYMPPNATVKAGDQVCTALVEHAVAI